MARAVPPWLHRILLRDFGPADPLVKLVVFTVNAFMDEGASCFPSQETIAKASGLGISTVRRKLAVANRGAWLSIEARVVYGGQRWRQYVYRACCPDGINLEAVVNKNGGTAEDLALSFEAQFGCIAPETLCGTHFPQAGKRRVPPRVNGTQAPPAVNGTQGKQGSSMSTSGQVPPAHASSTDHSRREYRPLTTEVPPAAGYEVPILSSNTKFQEEGQRASAPTGVLKRLTKIAEPESTKIARIRKVLAEMPEADDELIRCCVRGATLEEVRRERRAAA